MQVIDVVSGQVYFTAKKLFNASKKGAKLARGWELEGYQEVLKEKLETAQGVYKQLTEIEDGADYYYQSEIIIKAKKLLKASLENNSEDLSYYNKQLQKIWADFEETLFF